jgi:hypothetical protein
MRTTELGRLAARRMLARLVHEGSRVPSLRGGLACTSDWLRPAALMPKRLAQ